MSESTPSADRDERGRFAPGNPGGPGNPFGRLMAELRTAIVKAFTPERMNALGEVIVERALKGDMAAARLVLAYGIGKPAPAVDPDTLDLHEWQHFKEETGALAELPGIVDGVSTALPLRVVRAARPEVERAISRQMADALRTPAPDDILPPIVAPTSENSRVSPLPNGVNGATAAPFERNGTREPERVHS